MTDRRDVAAAAAEVKRLAERAAALPADRAGAALRLSQALDAADQVEDAQGAAERGIRDLTTAFLADPPGLAEPMRGLVAQYVAIARRSRVPTDPALLAPIAAALGHVVEAEDRADDGDPAPDPAGAGGR